MKNHPKLGNKLRKNSPVREVLRRYKKSSAAMIGLVIVVILISVALFADVIVPYERVIEQNYDAIKQPPSNQHIFGTDQLGRDLFARVVHGSRYSLAVGICTSLLALLIGGILGSAAGYYKGKIDTIIMRILDTIMSIPPILLALAIVSALEANLVNLIIALTIALIPNMARLVRSVILTVSGQDYIEAARAYGASNARIIIKYIIPNAVGTIIVQTTMNIASMILSAAGLSFIGMGIQPPASEWGTLLSEGQNFMRSAPYMLISPGIAILLAALGFCLVGDGLRDALDPKLKD